MSRIPCSPLVHLATVSSNLQITSATPPQSTSRQPWWCPNENHMALRDGKDPACPILGEHFEEVIELICKKKRNETLVNRFKIVHIIGTPKKDENHTQNLPFFT